KWDDVTPTWGIPIVNTRMALSEAVNKNTSSVTIEIGPDGLITFIYKDTVVSPKGDDLLAGLKFPDKFAFNPAFGFGAVIITKGQTLNPPDMKGFVPFEMDNQEIINELSFKAGFLNLTGISTYMHDISFLLTFPDLVSPSGTPYSKQVSFNYSNQLSIKDGPISLAGYKLKSASGQKNKLALAMTNIVIAAKDNGVIANPILPSDSIKFDIKLSEIKYKYLIGKFKPLRIETPFLSGSTEIAVFKNSVEADIKFADPSVEFDFRNSFGVVPAVHIQNAIMNYADNRQDSLSVNAGTMQIPGNTTLLKGDVLGKSVSTNINVNKSTSNIVTLLQGAPSKFTFNIPYIDLLASSNEDAYISDDSQIELYTYLRLPMHGAIRYLSLTDSIRDVQMVKPEHVDYVEFRMGSENSIPLATKIQVYFCDTNKRETNSKGRIIYTPIDSLISPPESDVIIDPATFDLNNLAATNTTKIDKIITVSKEKYTRISAANIIIVKGTLLTPNANSTDVKFTINQALTFKLSALAKLRVNPGQLTEGDLITKKKP
ncbi:MAG: hypothetical protein H7329_01245, partial [Opitutaceae bacterium]|nr:hypothetical protein [Cytophagales bacterium]